MTTKTRLQPAWLSATFPLVLSFIVGSKLGYAHDTFEFMFKKAVLARKPNPGLSRRGARDGDIFVATWVKSGTNWTMQLCQQIIWHGQSDFERLHDVVPWPESPGPFAIRLRDADRTARTDTDRLVIKTHLQGDHIPHHPSATYITVLRDPKDVCVSAYHFFLGLLQLHEHISADEWVDLYLRPGFLADMWADHVASFWSLRDKPNQHLLHFADMTRDLEGTVDLLADALGVSLSAAAREQVIVRGSFAYMRENEDKFAPPVLPIHGAEHRPLMVRKGKVGGSKDLLNDEQRQRIDAACLRRLRKMGCDYPYEARFSG